MTPSLLNAAQSGGSLVRLPPYCMVRRKGEMVELYVRSERTHSACASMEPRASLLDVAIVRARLLMILSQTIIEWN